MKVMLETWEKWSFYWASWVELVHEWSSTYLGEETQKRLEELTLISLRNLEFLCFNGETHWEKKDKSFETFLEVNEIEREWE